MSSQHKAAALPVDLLCTGLYVVELDRPWIETPFLFQGFRIGGEDDLQVLRDYCRRVYVDPRRSDRQAVESVKIAAAQRRSQKVTQAPTSPPDSRISMPSNRALEKSLGVLYGDSVEPNRKRFEAQVRAALVARHQTTQVAIDALHKARLGRSLDIVATRAAVARTAELVMADSSASLWLNQLREHSDHEARHAVNTCVLSLAFGAYLGMESRDLRRLGLGALLHDIGKMRIPPRLLEKRGSLSEQERELLQSHAEQGYQLLLKSGHVDQPVLDIVRLHHERWLGQGYPFGMLGETIPRYALVVGLVESYDAMTSERPYCAAVSPEQALQTLYSEAADHFGVDLVQSFIRCLGIFPAGSVVELDNGATGLVVGSKPGGGLWPTVLLLQNPDGKPYRKRLLINLAAAAMQNRKGKLQRVRRALPPAQAGIDVGAVVQQEFGLSDSLAA